MSKDGYSREGLFGTINHYDSKGHKIGESRPGLFGGYNNYDAKGHKVGESRPAFFGGYNEYDSKGHLTGHTEEGFFGSVHYDANRHRTGTTTPGFFGDQHHESSKQMSTANMINQAGSAAGINQDNGIRTAIAITAAAAASSSVETTIKPAPARSTPVSKPSAAAVQNGAKTSTAASIRYVIVLDPTTGKKKYYTIGDQAISIGEYITPTDSSIPLMVQAVVECASGATPVHTFLMPYAKKL